MPDLLTVTDAIDMMHWIDRLDAGVDNYRRDEMCEWLRGLVGRVERAEAEADRDERIVMAAESALCEHLRAEGRPAARGSNSGETLAGLGDELARLVADRDAARDEAGRHRSRCVSSTQELAAARAQAEDGREMARMFLTAWKSGALFAPAVLDDLRRMALRLLVRPVEERGDAGDAPGKPQDAPGASGEEETGNRPAGLADGVAGLLGAPGGIDPGAVERAAERIVGFVVDGEVNVLVKGNDYRAWQAGRPGSKSRAQVVARIIREELGLAAAPAAGGGKGGADAEG